MAITETKQLYQKVDNSKDFYLTFIHMFKPQLKIKSVTDIHVLTYLCLNMEYNSTRVTLPTSRRQSLCKELDIANTHLSNSLKRLIDIGLITGGNGEYELNPFLVWKGKLDEREKLLATKGIEIRITFKKTCPESIYNPFNGGSKEFDQ